MAEKRAGLVMQTMDTLESEEERMEGAEGNGSDEETDSECEEEEGATQSDSGVTAEGSSGQRRGLGRKRLSSETTDQLSPDAKYRHASNLHNERERERRKDLKKAVHKLRNQLQLWKTKKATTISVLKASEQEIKALKEMESMQNTDLENLKKHNNHLTWKLERLIGEYNMSSKAEQPPVPPLVPAGFLPFLPSSVPPAPPPISVAGAPRPVLLPPQMTTTTQSSLPFGTPNASPFPAAYQYSFLPPASPLTLASHPHPFPPHPTSAPFFIMSPNPPPQPIPFSTLMTHLSPSGPTAANIPSRFPFPGASFSPSHIPSSFATVVPSITVSAPPPAMPVSVLQYKNAVDSYNSAVSRKGSPPHLISVSEECPPSERQRERVSMHGAEVTKASVCPTSKGSDSTSRNPRGRGFERRSLQTDVAQPLEKVTSESDEHAEGNTEQFIDVESTEQEEEEEVWHRRADENTSSGIRHHHLQHAVRTQERSCKTHPSTSEERGIAAPPKGTRGPKNLHSPPALVKKAGVKDSNTVSRIIQRVQPATNHLTKETVNSVLKKHEHNLFKHTERGCDSLPRWDNHAQEVKNTPLPQPPQRTPVICS